MQWLRVTTSSTYIQENITFSLESNGYWNDGLRAGTFILAPRVDSIVKWQDGPSQVSDETSTPTSKSRWMHWVTRLVRFLPVNESIRKYPQLRYLFNAMAIGAESSSLRSQPRSTYSWKDFPFQETCLRIAILSSIRAHTICLFSSWALCMRTSSAWNAGCVKPGPPGILLYHFLICDWCGRARLKVVRTNSCLCWVILQSHSNWNSTVQYSTVQHSTVQYSAMQ